VQDFIRPALGEGVRSGRQGHGVFAGFVAKKVIRKNN
jgi:hypothetical protein